MELFCKKCGSKLAFNQKKAGSNSELDVEPCSVCSVPIKAIEIVKAVDKLIESVPLKPIEKKVVTVPNISRSKDTLHHQPKKKK